VCEIYRKKSREKGGLVQTWLRSGDAKQASHHGMKFHEMIKTTKRENRPLNTSDTYHPILKYITIVFTLAL
jgi:hypothetical protein